MKDPRSLTYTELVEALTRANERERDSDERHNRLLGIGESAMSSITEMVAALDCDFDRLEELREKRKQGCYSVGWNMPGYLPDSEPARFDDADSAREYLAEEIEQHADEIAETDESLANEMGEDAKRILTMDGNKSAADFGATLGGWHYWITFLPNTLSDSDEEQELGELKAAAGDCENQEDAQNRISEDPLSIEYQGTGTPGEPFEPDDAIILLATGGPAVRIVVTLGGRHGGVSRARLQVQDWFTLWTDVPDDSATLIRYCESLGIGEF